VADAAAGNLDEDIIGSEVRQGRLDATEFLLGN
jgi:hypothetical protein